MPQFCVFTKPFTSLSFDELADRIAELQIDGKTIDGLEAPIRGGGHVEPRRVVDELPALVEALEKRNLRITIMASDINDPADPLTEKVLRTASMLGIENYRMKYYKYDSKADVETQLRELVPKVADLAAMNHEFGVRGLYQNHAGNGYVGAALWDLHPLLDSLDVEDLAIAYDIRHAIVEGGMSWPTTLRMLRRHVGAVYVKDFRWNDAKPENVPLGEGRVTSDAIKRLNLSDFDGPVSIHEEYLDHRKPELIPDHLEATNRDLATLGNWIR